MSKGARRVLIININMKAATLAGCRKISRAVQTSPQQSTVQIVHWKRASPDLFKAQRPTHLILGPNETPFPRYPSAFDEFLRCSVRPRRCSRRVAC